MSQAREDTEELSVRARRGSLTSSEEAELEGLLRSNPTLRIAHLVGLEMDRATVVQAGDEHLIARAVEAALACPPAGSGSPLRASARKLHVASTIATCLGVIASTWWLVSALVRPQAANGRSQPSAASRRLDNVSISDRVTVAEPLAQAPSAVSGGAAETPASDLPPRVVSQPSAADSHTKRSTHAQHATPQVTAAELFHRANQARDAGRVTDAQRDYSRLVEQFPDSSQARLARISLGKLLLARGARLEADHEFQDYLSGGRGPLDEEALLGRARVLQAMARREDERAAWHRLLRDYPNSVYAEQARRRLVQLDLLESPRGP